MDFILKSIVSWKLLAPAMIVVMVIWLMISCAISLSFVRTTGRVVQLDQKGSGNNSCYCPVTVFRDAVGVEHTIESSGDSNPPRFPVGSAVTILYRAQNPATGMIEDKVLLWVVPSVFIVLGIFYGAIGMAISRLLQGKEARNAA